LASEPQDANAGLMLCGMDEVFVIAPAGVEKLWSWRAKEHAELPVALRGSFGTTDDCKPVADGKQILISSSSGGCALVKYPSGQVLWFARVTNAHSLEMLPRERVVVASSVGAKGNRLVLFDLAHSDQPLSDVALPSAHGVVWDEQRHRLWALGFDELRSYELKDWETDKPTLNQLTSHPLPDGDGHDLQAVPGGNDLVVTTGRGVHLFDRERGEFRSHPDLGMRAGMKCVSIHPSTGRIVFVQSAGDHWWSDKLGFLAPAGELKLESDKVYKARWFASSKAMNEPTK
jgi:hypothetical protein